MKLYLPLKCSSRQVASTDTAVKGRTQTHQAQKTTSYAHFTSTNLLCHPRIWTNTELKLHFSKRDLLSQRARIHQDLKSGQMSG